MGAQAVREALAALSNDDPGIVERALWRPVDYGSPSERDRRAIGIESSLPAIAASAVLAVDSAGATAVAADLWPADELLRLVVYPDDPGGRVPVSSEIAATVGRGVAAHAPLHAYRRAWGWPLRIGFHGPDAAALVQGLRDADFHPELYDLSVAGRGTSRESYDILVVEPSGSELVNLDAAVGALVVRAGAVDPVWFDDIVHHARGQFGVGAVIHLSHDDPTWLFGLIEHLSHDNPLDVALAMVDSSATLLADEHFLRLTSLRVLIEEWSRRSYIADQTVAIPRGLAARAGVAGGSVVPAVDLREMVREVAASHGFSNEGGVATEEAEASRALESIGAGRVEVDDVLLHAAMAEPPPSPPPSPPQSVLTPRYVNVRPSPLDPAGIPTDDDVAAFVAGVAYRFDVAIRERVARGALSLALALPEPAPGLDTVVEVTVFRRGQMNTAVTKTLALPASGNSDWCSFDLVIPTGIERFELVLAIYHGQLAQVGLLTGRIVADLSDVAEGDAWAFTVGSLGLAGVSDGPEQQVPAFIVDDSAGGTSVLDLSARGAVLQRSAQGKSDMRATLLAALKAEPTRPTLKKLAAPLARLAIAGRLLRDDLIGERPTAHDAAPTIRILSTEDSDPLPIEIVYGHPAPVTARVPVCTSALGGAVSCAADCAQRDSDAVVCPFGFWGVAKVVERMSPDRAPEATGASSSPIPMSRGALVGITERAAKTDSAAATTIAEAFRTIVTGGEVSVVDTWDDWTAAVAESPPLLVLVTHTGTVDDIAAIEIGAGDMLPLHRMTGSRFNPADAHPGPVVLLLGCDTAHIESNFTSIVRRLHTVGAEIVVALQTPVRGTHMAHLVTAFAQAFEAQLVSDGSRSLGALLRDTRADLLRQGRIVGLALVTTGDAGVTVS